MTNRQQMNLVYNKTYINSGNPAVLQAISVNAKKILDIGCGAGDNARYLQSQGMTVDGITLSEEEAKLARNFCEKVLVYNLEQGLPSELKDHYDTCLCSHVLEHICWPDKLLNAIHERLIRSNGTLIVALPNLMHYAFRWRLILGQFEYESGGIMDETHFRWYTFDSGRRLLENNGFKVNQAWADGAFPLYKLRKWLPQKLVDHLNRFACRTYPGLFGYQLIYKAVPLPRVIH